jgi:acyl-coenzyme A synthetase/AMP-(fatty) acid ligase
MNEYWGGNAATVDYIAYHAAERPDAVAIVDRGREITYAQFHRDLIRFVCVVGELGLERGSTVAVRWGELYPHWLLLIACEQLGMATTTFGDARLLGAVDLVLSEVRPPNIAPERYSAVTQQWLAGVFARTDSEMPAGGAKHPNDPLRIVGTSGTTGEPKRLLLTRSMFEAWVMRRIWSLDLTHESRTLVTMPFTNAGSYMLSTAVIRAGGTVLYADAKVGTVAALLDPVQGLTHLRVTPLDLRLILDALPPDFAKPGGLVVCTVGGAVSAPLRERALARLASEVIVSYGCNEVLFAAETRATGSEGVSTIYPWVEMEVVDERDTPLPPGTAGKVRIRDEAMATGYLDDPETTARKFRHGWFYPGDIGILHGPRRIQIVGREDELLNIGGIKMPASMLEALVLQHATVGDIGVCTTRNAEGFEEICVAVANPGHDDAELLKRVTDAFRNHPVGRFCVVKVARVPRNANGKIQRDLLKRAFDAATGQKE